MDDIQFEREFNKKRVFALFVAIISISDFFLLDSNMPNKFHKKFPSTNIVHTTKVILRAKIVNNVNNVLHSFHQKNLDIKYKTWFKTFVNFSPECFSK